MTTKQKARPVARQANRGRTARKGPAPVVAAPAPVEETLPNTREGLLGEVVKLCDQFDRLMDKPRPSYIGLNNRFGGHKDSAWAKLRDRQIDVADALESLLGEDEEIEEVIRQAIAIEPGKVPSWSRAGEFLIWMGSTPFRCVWDGFPFPHAWMAAADPRMPFPNVRGNLHVNTGIDSGYRSPADVFRSELVQLMNKTLWRKNKQVHEFELVSLAPQFRAEVIAYREEHEWLRKAIAKGPVDALAMPRHLQSIAMALPI